MITSNFKYLDINQNHSASNEGEVILVTSSVKGEGKTLIATNLANVLSNSDNKVILLGSDLRNPQLHKFFDRDKKESGISDMIYKNDKDYKKYLINNNNNNNKNDFDVLLSGAIPPNPTELLSSNSYKNLIKELKKSMNM